MGTRFPRLSLARSSWPALIRCTAGADHIAWLLVAVTGTWAAQPRHGHEHVLKLLGDLRTEVEPALHQRFRRDLFDIADHLLLEPVHHRVLHRLHIGETHKLPGFLRRAIYFNV